jgi:hypothetical protein
VRDAFADPRVQTLLCGGGALAIVIACACSLDHASSQSAIAESGVELRTSYENRWQVEERRLVGTEHAQLVLQLALERAGLTGTSFRSIRCGTTLCRIEARHVDPMAERAFVEVFPMVVGWSAQGFMHKLDGGGTLVYLDAPPDADGSSNPSE